MAENQTASEDSGQQQQQQQQQQQDHQQSNQQSTQPDSSPDQESSSDSITPNPRSKTMNMRSSLTSIKVPRAMSSTSSAADGDHQSHGTGKHHHNHHHHIHNNAGHHSHRVIHRTTSESLRLGAEYPGSSSMTNSTSNSSSIHGGGGSSSLASTTPTNNSNSTTSNHSHSMSSSSSHTHSSHPHPHPHSHSHQHISNSGGGPMQRKPKTSSFQITSVTVGNKLSSDNGDDSADDLDESHTDDNSRITDLENETPSVSEDTFSKEDVFFANNALSTTAPVIPTSAQYGLVVVDPIGPSVGQTIQNVQVNVADNIINVVSAVGNKNKKPEVKETQHRSERFKVVKIESTEPFRRGRWMCMDYLDHSGNQVLNKEITPEKTISGSTVSGISVATTGDDTSRGTTQTAIIVTNDTSANVGGGSVENHIDAAAKLTADGNLNIYRSESQTSAGTGQNTNQTITHAQTLGGPINLQQQQQQLPPTQQQQQQLPNQFQGQQFEGGHGQTTPLTDFQQQPQHQVNGNEPSVAGQSQPASFFVTQLSAPAGNGGAGSTPTTFQQQPQQSTPAHGVTLPANILMQNGGGGSGEGNSTSFQPVSFTPASVAPVAADIGGGGATATASSGQQPQQTSQVYATQPVTNVAPQSYPSAANIIGGATYTTNAPASVNDTVQGAQQQSESNAGTPSSGSGQSQQQPPPSQQPPQFQTMHSNPVAGQTMPILNQMTFDTQSQQQQQQPSQAATNTPATISDPTAIAATIQQQQIDNNNFTANNSNSIIINNNSNNNNNNNPAASSSSTTAESSTAITSGAATGTSNNISQPQQAPSSSSSLSVAGSLQGSSGGSAAAPSTTGSTDDHQLHHNPETETESCASSLALALANRRKRNSSIPQLPILAPIFNFNDPTDPLNNHNTADEDTTGTQNIFTHLALGDERYKLPTSNEAISSLGEYSVMRSMPIPIRAGTVGVGRHMNCDVMAYSASPTNSAYPYSPFYNGSPSPPDTVQQPLSISYDPSYASNRLYVPTLMSQGHHRNYGDNNRLIRVIDVSRRCGIDGNGETSSATAAALAGGVGVASVLKSASGTSAVAIDNKIEQAMDLVKSHLMIAVREEVEVLKEKISELMDKINQLEVENTILKSNMSQETLHQLQLQAQLQIAGNGTANLIAAAQQPTQQQTQSQQPTAQPSQTPSSQQPNQQAQQQAAPQANPANTTNGPMS